LSERGRGQPATKQMVPQQPLARQKRKPPRPPAALPASAGLAAAMVTDRPKLERHSSMPRASSLRHDAHERPRLERRASLPRSSSARAASLPHSSPAMQTPKPPPPQRAKSFARPSSASASLPENQRSRDAAEAPARLRRSKSLAREPNRRRRSAALELVKATPQAPGRPAVPGTSAKVEAELGKFRKGWEAAEHRCIDLKVELLQTQVEAQHCRPLISTTGLLTADC